MKNIMANPEKSFGERRLMALLTLMNPKSTMISKIQDVMVAWNRGVAVAVSLVRLHQSCQDSVVYLMLSTGES